MAFAAEGEAAVAMIKTAVAALLFAALPVAVAAAGLPDRVAPPQPFPRILRQAPTVESIAPGIQYGEYALETAAGPIAVHVVAIAPHRSDVKVAEVQAFDALQSRGETIGSMAKRTGAVAGVNGDYFDIGNTNRPTNIVVRDGVLLQMPRKRYALAIERDGYPQITEFSFSGRAAMGGQDVPLDGVNQLPAPNGGTVLITPDFGSVPANDDRTLVALQPLGGTPPIARYRVTEIADNLKTQPPGYYLGIGPNAYGSVNLPAAGDVVAIEGDLSPLGLGNVVTAIGGGPLILHAGSWYDDEDGPRGGEYEKRIPCSGAAISSDGTLFLLEVDGRQPAVSVGLTRREFAALMRALGATEGMAFDGGGSSTMVARRLGDPVAEMVNSPSDGRERPVANGIFAYSTDPIGPPVRLIARPSIVRALAGAAVPIRVVAIDASSHAASVAAPLRATVQPPSLGTFSGGTFVARRAGRGRIVLRSGALKGTVALEVWSTPADVSVEPPEPNVDPHGTLALTAQALDPHGYALALPATLRWKTTSGSIDRLGRFRAGTHNAVVTVAIGRTNASTSVTVGTHEIALPFAQRVRFFTVPHGGGGSVARDPACASCTTVAYAFGSGERAAYAGANLSLPPGAIGISFDVLDDGSGSRLKIATRNAIDETVLLPVATLDQPGWRRVTVRFPSGGARTTQLSSIYLLPPKGMQVSSGQIEVRDVRAVVAGQR